MPDKAATQLGAVEGRAHAGPQSGLHTAGHATYMPVISGQVVGIHVRVLIGCGSTQVCSGEYDDKDGGDMEGSFQAQSGPGCL